ncbi:molybdopterin-binding protein [Actinoplanes palleronii]|uniref:Molybdopterin molybdenumtransferase n=1 Tax=Actinoplanes palleronii TaxID=113570 RepID=A0ABQ4BE79_9ACTN|nr:molybdopterin-binding protein [Actinoplanes palleronii]GIE69001.1 molybdopterin molybdenumtransferase MoeA [Actinoplanes palleronii]
MIEHGPGMPWAVAHATAGDLARPLPAERTTPDAAIGRILAVPLRAAVAVPAFDTAAMDGYAITGPGPWRVVGRRLAGPGEPVDPLLGGTAIEIGTGAAVPPTTEAVLPYEDSTRHGDLVSGEPRRPHIRRTGEDLRPGDLLADAGRPVTATMAAAAVQAGVEELHTHRPPAVTLFVTGDEVITSGQPGPGQVRDSFTGLVSAVTARAGGHLLRSTRLPDDPAALADALGRPGAEVVVVSGSSSAGAADHLHRVLTALDATWHVRGVACRPGHPQGLAELPGGRWVVSLPGNPYAGLVAALTLLEPLLAALAGRAAAPPVTAVVTGEARLYAAGVRIVPVTGTRIRPGARPGSLHTAAAADSLAVLSAAWRSGDPAPRLVLP